MNDKYININKIAEIKGLKSTRSIRIGINKGTVYMYVASPVSAIMYKCDVTEANIPYEYKDEHLKITKVMKIKLKKKYNKNFMTFAKLNKYGINAIRGVRNCPKELCDFLK